MQFSEVYGAFQKRILASSLSCSDIQLTVQLQWVVSVCYVQSTVYGVLCTVCNVRCAMYSCCVQWRQCSAVPMAVWSDDRLIQDEPQYPPCFCLQFGLKTAGKSRNRHILNMKLFAKFVHKLQMSNWQCLYIYVNSFFLDIEMRTTRLCL